MDAQLDPAKFAGLAEGNAHVIRNAAGRASDDANWTVQPSVLRVRSAHLKSPSTAVATTWVDEHSQIIESV